VKKKSVKRDSPETQEARKRLQSLRVPLLDLHKAIVDSERVQYEKTFGKIHSPNQFLHLLTNDPWFAWLSPLSQLIVSIDEALDSEEPLTSKAVESLFKETAHMLKASETGEGFSKHYFEALQRDPDVVMAHAQVTRVKGWPRAS
jgi:hypothetical protein